MADNLELNLSLDKVTRLLALTSINPSEYCILATENASETIVITSNHLLKLILIEDYNAKEISDWTFNEEYQKNKGTQKYTIIGDGALIDKGY